MTKKKKAIKLILIIVLPVLLILGAVGGFFIWYFQPINRVNRAFEAEDYATVVELWDRLNIDDAEDVQDRLYAVVKDYHDDYIDEKISYEEAVDFLELVTENALSNHRKTRKLRAEIDMIYESREAYSAGVRFMEACDYLIAIDRFEMVVEDDVKYREMADRYIEECRTIYISIVIAEADEYINVEKYELACEVLTDALERFPDDDALASKLEEVAALMYSDIEGKWYTTYDFGDLIAAEMGLSGYNLYFPAELVFEFDGTKMKMYVNEDSIESALDAMTADKESMEALYAVAEQYGVNKFEADVLVTVVYGGSYTRFLMDQYGTEISNALNSFKCEINYTADSRKIHLEDTGSNNYFSYSSDNSNSLNLTSYTGNTDPINVLSYPIALKRKMR